MSIGTHDFAIPHEYVQPARDIVIVRMPLPPKMVGSVHVPELARDMAQHNVMAGRIVNMGPMAFQYKDGSGADGNGLARQDVKVGDWVVIRPYAGVMMQGGKFQVVNGYRYLSSFQDVLAVIPADKMPDPATLIWDDDAAETVRPVPPKIMAEQQFSFDNKKAV